MAEQTPGAQPADGRDPHRPRRGETPFGLGVPLGRWAGVPIRAHWSVVVALALFTTLLAAVDLRTTRPGSPTLSSWVVGTITAVALFLTLLAHELAHALLARHYGLGVRRITLWMLGGLTELEDEARTPRADALIAAAGPLTSLGIGGMLALTARLVGGDGLAVTAIAWLATLNILLGAFNLLPGAPLDGGRLLRALIWWRRRDRARAAELAAAAGRGLGMTLVGLGLLGGLIGSYAGLWTALVGWFILNGAAGERFRVRAETLRGLTVGEAMSPTPQVAPTWWTVERFAAHLTPEMPRQVLFPLVDVDGRFVGVVTLASLEKLPPERRSATCVGDLARSVPLLRTTPTDDLGSLLLPLHLHGGIAVVLDGERPLGVVTEADLVRVSQLARIGRNGDSGSHPD